MGWKTINGGRYYYRAERVGDRVQTTYFGTGKFGSLMARTDEILKAEREDKRRECRAEREESALEEKSISDWFDGVQAVADAAMVAAEFHKHKGQWRRKRT
jgi:hypothetical protein